MSRLFCLLGLCCTLSFFADAQTDRKALYAEFKRLDSLWMESSSSDLKSSLETGKKMFEIAQVLQEDSLIMTARQNQGEALHMLGVFDAALKLYYDNMALAEQNHHCYFQVKSGILIGRVYQSMNDITNSQIFMQKAKRYAIECGHYQDTVAINYEIGFNMAAMDGDTAAAIRLIEQNIQVARKLHQEEDILLGIDNLANLLANLDNPRKALEYELELLPMMETWDDNVQKTAIYEHLAEIYIKLGQWENAQKYQQKTFEMARLIGSNDWIYECYKLQSMIDEGRGQFKSALANHQRYLELKDSVYQSHYDENMAAMSTLYELENKQKTIAVLEKDQKIKEGEIEEQRILLLVGLLLLLIIILFNRFLHQRKVNKMREAFARDLINAQENERQMIARELHDSVGQNILFIKNRLQKLTPDAPLAKSVDDALDEVRSIAKGLYPNQLEQYGLRAAVDALCELVQESSGIFVSCDLQGIDDKLSREAKINCYRIVQECLNNSMKHAEATAIRITSSLLDNKVELVIQDNGKGFDKAAQERQPHRSFGLTNMAERIKMLRGKLELETATNKGAKLTFAFPV